MNKYLKLGEKATCFYDPQTRFGISGNQVKEVLPYVLKSPRVKRFITGGGLVVVSKEEYKEYLAKTQKTTEKPIEEAVVQKEEKVKLFPDMTKADLYDWIKNKSNWQPEDIEEGLGKTNKAHILEFIEETNEAYE